ncbi:hypothetical protein NKJ74_26920 [Mesorhizobium sp. M0046]
MNKDHLTQKLSSRQREQSVAKMADGRVIVRDAAALAAKEATQRPKS